MTPEDLEDLASEIADQFSSFLLSVRAVAVDDAEDSVPILLLETSQLLLAGGRLGAIRDVVPDEPFETDAGPEPDDPGLDELRERLTAVLKPVNTYREVFDPLAPKSEIQTRRISDDLALVCADLAHGLAHLDAERVTEALWWWQFSYLHRWGPAASAVQRALLSVVAHSRLRTFALTGSAETGGFQTQVRTGTAAGAEQRNPRDSGALPASADIHVSVYISDETQAGAVEDAVEEWLAGAGLSVSDRDDPVFGSWWRRMRARVQTAATTPAGQEVTAALYHVAETRASGAEDARIAGLLLDGVAKVLPALENVEEAVVHAQSLLIVKNGKSVAVVQLSPAQQYHLARNPDLLAAPKLILAALDLCQEDSAAPQASLAPHADTVTAIDGMSTPIGPHEERP